jgi:hypothetical protein
MDELTRDRRRGGRVRRAGVVPVLTLAVGLLALVACRPTGMVGPPSFEAQASSDFPSAAAPPSRLVDVRAGAHDGFDRVVVELDAATSWRVGFVDPPVRERGSGDEVPVDGEALLQVVLSPATAFELPSGIGDTRIRPTYTGPDRFDGPGTAVVTEVVGAGEHERTMSWVIGLERRAPFAVVQYASPPRIVVDVLAA